MKYLLSFSITLTCVAQLSAQHTFQRTYGQSLSEEARDVIPVTGGYVVAGMTESTTPGWGKDIALFSVDAAGQLSWSKTYGSGQRDEAYCIREASGGGFIVAGRMDGDASGTDSLNAYLLRTDNAGAVTWHRAIGGTTEDVFYSVAELPDSGFVATGFTYTGSNDKNVMIARVGKNGNLLWLRSCGGTGDDIGNSVCVTSSGHILVAGSTTSFSAGTIVYLLKLDPAGNLVWSRSYDFSQSATSVNRVGYDVIQNSAGQYVIAGKVGMGSINDAQMFAMCLDTTGASVVWANSYYMNSGNGEARSVRQASNGDYILGGTMGNFTPALIRINSSGTHIWDKYYSVASAFTNQGYGYAARFAPDGGVILTGRFYTLSGNDTAMFLYKTDANGSCPCNSNPGFIGNTNPLSVIQPLTTSTIASYGTSFYPGLLTISTNTITETEICSNVGIAENSAELLSQPYPNPAAGFAHIGFMLPGGENCGEIVLYDIAGQEVKRVRVDRASGEVLLSTADLEAGTYYYRLHTKSSISGGRTLVVISSVKH